MLFLDSSSLVKLFSVEPGSDETRASAQSAELVAASRITYAECRAAIARGSAERRITAAEALHARQSFERIWAEVAVIELDGAVSVAAADLADRHGLRGMDAIQLASALWTRDSAERPIAFATWDDRLRRAAREEGLSLLPA
ncbi:MAG: type II toxin-antitoxin system VapC family toxin [Candidatus Limnocylindria bacterium]